MPKLAGFSLVGGTALSLKYGHRKSIDLDLFCEEAFDREIILKTLEESFGKNFVYDGKITTGQFLVLFMILKWILFITNIR